MSRSRFSNRTIKRLRHCLISWHNIIYIYHTSGIHTHQEREGLSRLPSLPDVDRASPPNTLLTRPTSHVLIFSLCHQALANCRVLSGQAVDEVHLDDRVIRYNSAVICAASYAGKVGRHARSSNAKLDQESLPALE